MGIIRLHDQKTAMERISACTSGAKVSEALQYAMKYLRSREQIKSVNGYDMLSAEATEKMIAMVAAIVTMRSRDLSESTGALREGVITQTWNTSRQHVAMRSLPDASSAFGTALGLVYSHPESVDILRSAIRERGYGDSEPLLLIMSSASPALAHGML